MPGNIEKEDNKIIVTTIQKLEQPHESGKQTCPSPKASSFIFEECHHSICEAQRILKKKFNKYYQSNFTGTPIFPKMRLAQKSMYLSNRITFVCNYRCYSR
jgi:type I restriction enzyme R subunit